MANLTKSQRHNKNLENIFNDYRERQNKLPAVELYKRFLELAQEKLNISINEARNKYGLYTIKQWEELLGLGWNKK